MFRLIKEESGQSIVFVALMLVVLMGFGALAIDIGYMTYQKSSLQNAADSAALAGAMLVAKAYENDVVKEKMKSYAEDNFKEDATVSYSPDISINKDSKTVDITINQEVPKFLGGIISNKTETMTVYAKAEYNSYWDGEALPFINLSDKYLNDDGNITTNTLSIWGKEGPGEFEVIDKKELTNPETNTIIIDWQDNLSIANGQLGDLHKVVSDICKKDAVLYVFSIKNDVLKTRVTFEGNKYYYTNNAGVKKVMNSTPDIDKQDLILLEIKLTQDCITPGNGNNDRIYFKVNGTYDVYNGQMPDNYISKVAKTTSTLIQ